MRLQLPVLLLVLLSSCTIASRAQDGAWERLGPVGGTVTSLESSFTGGTIYLGTTDGHVFASNDRAGHWELRGRVSTRTDAVISRLLADPSRPDVVFAAAWFQQPGAGGGVFRSEDAGRTWTLLGLEKEAVRALELASAKPLILVAGTRSGVFRSEDAGGSWRRISPLGDPEIRNVDSLAVDPRDSNVVYAGTYHLPWKTTDAGQTWNPIATGLIDDSDIMSIRVDATSPERMFLSACSGIYRSINTGGLWTKLQGIPYTARRTHSIVQDSVSPKTLFAATTAGLWVTRDMGESWKITTSKELVVNSALVIRPAGGEPARVVLGTEVQGVLISDDSGETFRPANEGFTHQVVKQLIADPREPKHLLMLLEQNGEHLLESRDAARSWTTLPAQIERSSAKNAPFRMDAVDKVFATAWGWLAKMQSGSLWILGGNSKTWHEWKLRLVRNVPIAPRRSLRQAARSSLPAQFISSGMPLGFSGSEGFVQARSTLLRCDQAGNCHPMRAFQNLAKTDALQVSTDGSQLAVVADSRFALSRDSGETAVWRELPAQQTTPYWIEDSADARPGAKGLYVGTPAGIYFSENDGAAWARLTGGLPAAPFNHFLYRRNFMAATLREGGLYLSTDEGKSWRRVEGDAERSRFAGLTEIQPGIVAIGSQSEGVLLWTLPPAGK